MKIKFNHGSQFLHKEFNLKRKKVGMIPIYLGITKSFGTIKDYMITVKSGSIN